AKLVNLVPDGGIWMTTQRPEWNDVNNALVGRGVSVVTLAQLRRYVVALEGLAGAASVTDEFADLVAAVTAALRAHVGQAARGFDPAERRPVMDALGTAGSVYRTRVYAGLSGRRAVLEADAVRELLDLARTYVDAGLRANRRDDGLYHSYNLLDLG